MQKKIGVRIQAKWVRSGPKLSFLSFFHVWFISFPGNCIGCDSMERFLTTNRGKTHEKNLGPQIGSESRVYHFLKAASVFVDIAQDHCLGQCLTSSRAETSEKLWPKLGLK